MFRRKEMPDRFLSSEDAFRRINGCMVRYRGEVYYAVVQKTRVSLFDVELSTEREVKRISINDPDLDISSIPLGYFLFNGSAYYAMRHAVRKQSAGICLQNVIVRKNNVLGDALISKDEFFSPLFKRMLLNKYPSISETERKRFEVPISREFCLDWENADVYFKGELFGTFNKRNLVVSPLPSFDDTLLLLRLQKLGVTINGMPAETELLHPPF